MRSSIRIAACLGALVLPSAALATDSLYVPLGDANAVVEIDTSTDSIRRTFDAVQAAHGLAITPQGNRLIVGSFATRDAAAKTPAKPQGMSDAEHSSHHGAATPATEEISSVSVIDIASGNVVRRIDVPGAVHHVAVSPDGALAAITHPMDGTISLIDLSSLSLAATIATGEAPNYAVFSHDGRDLFVSNGGDGTISVIDTERRTPTATIKAGLAPEHLVLSQDGATLFVNDVEGDAVLQVDTAARTLARSFDIGATLHGIDLSADGKALYVAVLGDDTLARLDLGSGDITRMKAGEAPYHLMRLPGSGKLYLSSSQQSVIRVVDAATMSVTKEIAVGGIAHQMASAPSH